MKAQRERSRSRKGQQLQWMTQESRDEGSRDDGSQAEQARLHPRQKGSFESH